MIKNIKNSDAVDHIWVGQTVLAGDSYTIQPTEEVLWANDSTVLVDIANGIAVVNDGSVDITNVNTAIVYLKDGMPKDVTTQLEKDDKELVLASDEQAFSGTTCTLSVKIPGTLGDMTSRYVAGGYCFTNVFGWGDRVTNIQVLDKDFVYAGLAYPGTPEAAGIPNTTGLAWVDIMPGGVEMGTYADVACPAAQQGWRLWCDEGSQGGIDIDPLGGFGKLPGLAFLVVTLEKTGSSAATQAVVNIWWGKKKT